MLILFDVKSVFGSELVVVQKHICDLFPFLRSFQVLDIGMLINVTVFHHDVKASINDFSIFGIVDEVSHCVPVQGVGFTVLYDSGGFLLQVRAYMI